jgi:c-di-GMP-binding flagellar brake protein YcgR
MFSIGKVIHLEWGRRTLKSRIRAWKNGHYILVDLDYEKDTNAGLALGHDVVARFVKDGQAFGFITKAVEYLFDHQAVVFEYPEHIELSGVREIKWFPVSAPVDILHTVSKTELDEWKGVAREVSARGVKMVSHKGASKGSKLFIAFNLVTGERVDNAQVYVKSVEHGPEGYEMELEFIFLAPENKQAVDNFVELVSTHGGGLF